MTVATGISIHTPARGVTRQGTSQDDKTYLISIHTPARGVTNRGYGFSGGDSISIHTPARGVTPLDGDVSVRIEISIHTPARGVTAYASKTLQKSVFQSTLPQGEWQQLFIQLSAFDKHFNPHSRKGSDNEHPDVRYGYAFQSTLPQGEWLDKVPCLRDICDISIHTPARGVTISYLAVHPGDVISIHTPARGVTRFSLCSSLIVFISIHTPARGVTLSIPAPPLPSWFQSTLPQGEWQSYWGRNRHVREFQSTLPQGEWQISDLLKCLSQSISIHTPARGVTAKLHDFYLKTKYFYQFYLICFWCYSYFYRILKRFNLCKQIFRCESLSVFLNT